MNNFHSVMLTLSFLLIQSVFATNFVTSKGEQNPRVEFEGYTLIKPRIYNRRDEMLTFPIHDDHITISFLVGDEELVVDLTIDEQLMSKIFFRKTQEKGAQRTVRPTHSDLCHYKGKIRNRPHSWAALSTCSGLSGAIYDGNRTYYVEKRPSEDDVHFLYKQGRVGNSSKRCGHTETKFKRSIAPSNATLRGPYNANKGTRYVELVLVVDNAKYRELNQSVDQVELYCKTIVNIMNGIYSPLNVYIALKGVVIWTEFNEIEISPNGDQTLTNFLRYRREKLTKEFPNDNAQLVTKSLFENSVVGKAFKKVICTYQYSGGVSSDYTSVTGIVANTVAHMLGHNFGMEHDTPECSCPDDACIMSASTSSVVRTQWSSCSKEALKHSFDQGLDYCLRDKPTELFKGPVCGNGFVEEGEECDCGLSDYCTNSCCNATTCKLRDNATCATGECCDLESCNLKESGNLCRAVDGECDLPEYCTGESEFCPTDVFKLNGEVCKNGTGYCYQNHCGTHSDQCKLLWGDTGSSTEDKCYSLNIKGNRHGNCGYNWFNNTFIKCNEEDIFCGLLHCQHLTEAIQFGLEAASILSSSFVNQKGGIIVSCRTAIIDLGTVQPDPGLVPNGAKCGEGKMCVSQKCVSVSSIQEGLACPHNCYNNGWCNSLGHCHCKAGYKQPYCQELLCPGGSVDSGPAKP